MRRAAVILSFFAVVALGGRLLAHEGHAHKVMGTVTKIDADKSKQIEVKTTDGQTTMITVDDKTKYLKGRTPASLKDVQVGAKIVATVTKEGSVNKASEVMLGEGGHDAAKPHQH